MFFTFADSEEIYTPNTNKLAKMGENPTVEPNGGANSGGFNQGIQINLDLIKKTEIPPIEVKRTDFNSILFHFVITDDGRIVDLTDCQVTLTILKPSGLTVYQDCEIVDPLDGECEVF